MDFLTSDQKALLLLVTHGGTLNAIMAWWLRLEIDLLSTPSTLFRIFFEAYPASITVLRINEFGEHTIERSNDTVHLYEAGLSERINVSVESKEAVHSRKPGQNR
jgi:broad specificity phosphatase PhoE